MVNGVYIAPYYIDIIDATTGKLIAGPISFGPKLKEVIYMGNKEIEWLKSTKPELFHTHRLSAVLMKGHHDKIDQVKKVTPLYYE